MSAAQEEPKFCILVGGVSNTSLILQENQIHLHATQEVKIEGIQKTPLTPLEQPKEEKEETISPMEWFQAGLTVASCIPGVATVAGLIDAGISAYKGDYAMAALSLAAAVPIAGEAAAIAKLGAKAQMLAKIGRVVGAAAQGAKAVKAIKALQKASIAARFLIAAKTAQCMYEQREQIAEMIEKMRSGEFNWKNPHFLLGVVVTGLILLKPRRAKASEIAEGSSKAPHGNSKASTKPQHGYEISEKATGDVAKTGISGQPLNKNGTSPRANSQVNKWNKEAGHEKYEADVVKPNMPDRQTALDWEKDNAQRLWEEGNSMNKHQRPKPWED